MVFQNLSVKRTKKRKNHDFSLIFTVVQVFLLVPFLSFLSFLFPPSSSDPSARIFAMKNEVFLHRKILLRRKRFGIDTGSKERFPKNRPFPAPSCNGCNGCNGFIPALVAPHFPSDFWDFRIFSWFVDAQMHQDSNVRSLMRFAKLYNLELHLMTKVEHEKHVKPSLQSLGSASIQPRKSHLKVNVPLLK